MGSIKSLVLNNNRIKHCVSVVYNALTVRVGGGSLNSINIKQGNFYKKCFVSINGRNNKIVVCEDGGNLANKLRIFIVGNNNTIYIGKNNYIKDLQLIIEDDNNEIRIGDNNSFSGSMQIAALEGTSIKIGNDCLFSSNIYARSSDSHVVYNAVTGERINNAKDILIGDRVWIGQNVTILKNSVIPEDSVVGVGSIINKVFLESKCILAGTPAKVVKRNIKWTYERH